MLEDGVPLVEKLVDVFIKAEPAITATADGIVALLDVSASLPAFWEDMFAAMADGKVTVEELRDAYKNLPEPIFDAVIGINQFLYDTSTGFYNFAAGGLNNIIGFVNRLLDALRPAAAAMNQLLGTNIVIPRLQEFALRGPMSFDNLLRGIERTEFSTGGGGRIAMASGAYVPAQPGGVAATIGEGRYDEVVLPLSSSVLSDLGEAIGGNHSTPIQLEGNTVAYLHRMMDGRAQITLSQAVTELAFDVRAGGIAA